MDLGTIRFWLWGLVGALALTAGAGVFLLREPPKPASGFGTGSYDLVDQKGNAVDETIFVGHPSALFFGFTHCPEVCPTTMAQRLGFPDRRQRRIPGHNCLSRRSDHGTGKAAHAAGQVLIPRPV